MKTIKKLIIATALASVFGPTAVMFAMNADNDEERKQNMDLSDDEDNKQDEETYLAEQKKATGKLWRVSHSEEENIDEVNSALINGADIQRTSFDGKTPLHYAAHKGHTATVRLLLANKAQVDAVDKFGQTPLHDAANVRWGCNADAGAKAAEILLAHKANVNATTSKYDVTPLQHAAYYGHPKTARILLDGKADAYATDHENKTPLDDATNRQNHEVEQVLLAYNAAQKLLFIACNSKKENIDAVYDALENGANLNATNKDGYTPLDCAISRGHIETARILLKNNADINATDREYGENPLHLAARTENAAAVHLLVTHEANVNATNRDGNTPLHEAQNAEIAKILLDNKANVNAANKYGCSPLHKAALDGRTEAMQALIDSNANVNAIDNFGSTPLHEAQNAKSVRILVNGSADIEKKNDWNETPLLYAARNGHTESALALLDNNANVNTTNKCGHTPLHKAKNTEIVQILVHKNANVDAMNTDGETPLHVAAGSGNSEAAQTLISCKAAVDAKRNYIGSTPLHLAVQQEHCEVAQVLLNHGANINEPTISRFGYNCSPVYRAADWHLNEARLNMVKLLLLNGAADPKILEIEKAELQLAIQEAQLEIEEAKPLYVAFADPHTRQHLFLSALLEIVTNYAIPPCLLRDSYPDNEEEIAKLISIMLTNPALAPKCLPSVLLDIVDDYATTPELLNNKMAKTSAKALLAQDDETEEENDTPVKPKKESQQITHFGGASLNEESEEETEESDESGYAAEYAAAYGIRPPEAQSAAQQLLPTRALEAYSVDAYMIDPSIEQLFDPEQQQILRTLLLAARNADGLIDHETATATIGSYACDLGFDVPTMMAEQDAAAQPAHATQVTQSEISDDEQKERATEEVEVLTPEEIRDQQRRIQQDALGKRGL